MSEQKDGTEHLGELAEEAMSDKRDEVGSEAQSRELWDMPTESAGTLADHQQDDA